MKPHLLFSALALVAGSLLAANASPQDDLTAAAKKLGEKASYSWITTVVVPEGSQFRPGPTEGKTEKDGFTHVTMRFGENTTQIVMKGDKAAFTNREGEWESLEETDSAGGPGRFMAMMVRNFRAPAAQATDLLADITSLKKDGEVYVGDLTEDGAKKLLTFRRRAGTGEGPTASDAKGSARFWVKDGTLAKYEFKVSGKITFNNNEREVDRTTTVEIKDVGATKVTMPDEARKKLS